jgi:hypothetical protein
VFNENITIKNGPFKLNSDGSGNIGTNLNWDSDGVLFGTLINKIESLEKRCQQLQETIDLLHSYNPE